MESFQTKNLSFELPHTGEVLFENIDLSIEAGDKIALVGRNGSGKTTLLKILNGELQPTTGEIKFKGITATVSQLNFDQITSNQPIYEFIQAQHEEWWKVTEILEQKFKLTMDDLDRAINSLSGGELVKMNLAIALAKKPDILLLDEPTNHLDIESIEILRGFLEDFEGGFVIVSHNRFFLDLVVNEVWELDEKTVRRFGGNYSDYNLQKETISQGKARDLEAAQKELKKARRAKQAEEKRAARSNKEGKKAKADRSMSSYERGWFAEKASQSAGKKGSAAAKKIEDAANKVEGLKTRKSKRAYIEIQSENARINIINLDNVDVSLGNTTLIGNINLSIKYGDRIVITGPNGSGKTTLVKTIQGLGGYTETVGEVKRNENASILYMSQKYDIVDPNLSLVENMQKANPLLSYEEARRYLGNVLFYQTEDVEKLAGTLSGGETARLSFAMITSFPVSILILDEPTNNLDIETLEIITDSLNNFPGAILLISHDIDLMQDLNIEQAYKIENKKLKLMKSRPIDGEDFYYELLERS